MLQLWRNLKSTLCLNCAPSFRYMERDTFGKEWKKESQSSSGAVDDALSDDRNLACRFDNVGVLLHALCIFLIFGNMSISGSWIYCNRIILQSKSRARSHIGALKEGTTDLVDWIMPNEWYNIWVCRGTWLHRRVKESIKCVGRLALQISGSLTGTDFRISREGRISY